MAVTEKEIEQLESLKSKLVEYRSVFTPVWNDIIKYHAPSYSSASIDKPGTEGAPAYADLYNTTGVDSSNTMADGIQGYAFGRNISWFKLQFENEELMKQDSNKKWLQSAEKVLYGRFNNSNFYDESRASIKCGADFGTTIMTCEQDLKRSIPVFHTLHPGTYVIQENNHGEVDTLFREFWLTKEDAIEQFGEENLPNDIINNEQPGSMFMFNQYIGPDSRIKLSVDGNEEFVNVYWPEIDKKKACKESRSAKKQFFAWRWAKNPCGSPWGVDSPGLTQIPNIKTLQTITADLIRLSQLQGRPPIKKTKGLRINFYPSGMTDLEPGEDFDIQQLIGDLSWTEMTRQRLEKQVEQAYYVDFFLALLRNNDKAKTATEVHALQNEMSAIMSAFYSRLAHEFIEPVLEEEFESCINLGLFEELPAGLEDQDISIDYVSPLAMLQKRAHSLSPTKQFLNDVLALREANPAIMDKLNLDAYVDISGESYSVDQRIITPDAKVKQIRDTRMQIALAQQKQQQQFQQADLGIKAYKEGSKAPEEGSPAEKTVKGGSK